MRSRDKYEMIFLPSKTGIVKIYIYGFNQYGSAGRVFASLNDINVSLKGYNRNKTIIKALTKLNESLLKMMEE